MTDPNPTQLNLYRVSWDRRVVEQVVVLAPNQAAAQAYGRTHGPSAPEGVVSSSPPRVEYVSAHRLRSSGEPAVAVDEQGDPLEYLNGG